MSKSHEKNDFDFDRASNWALKFSSYLNSTTGIMTINQGQSKIKCHNLNPIRDKEYPIENYESSTCACHEMKWFRYNFINDTDLALDENDLGRKIFLKGDELVYNVFYFKDESILSNSSIYIDVPIDSFAVLNIESSQIESLNKLADIHFVNNKIGIENLLFNFIKADLINFGANSESKTMTGSILAPYANVTIRGLNEEEKNCLNGQVFSKSLNGLNFNQNCELFEAFH